MSRVLKISVSSSVQLVIGSFYFERSSLNGPVFLHECFISIKSLSLEKKKDSHNKDYSGMSQNHSTTEEQCVSSHPRFLCKFLICR
jgi:hypothetical protein